MAKYRKVLLALCLFTVGVCVHAQYLRTSYFMEGVSSRLQLNPALQPTNGYINIPVLGSFNIGASSNVLGTSDIIDILDSGEDLFSNDALYNRLKTDNRLNVNLNTELLSFGWHRGKGFWSVNVGLRADVGASIPKSMFEYMRDANGFSLTDGLQSYKIGNERFDLNAYAEVGVGREDGKTKGEYSPLFYKKDRFEVLDSNTFWLSQYPDSVGFIGWDGACSRIATWAKLKDKKTGKIFMAVNTHFDHVGTEARRKGALLIIEKIKEIVGDQPAVLTGDFNVTDQSEAYETITTNEFVLKDAYKEAAQREGVDYTFHDFGRIPADSCDKIDFIFVTPQIKVESSYIPQEAEEAGQFLSDHNPEVVHLSF